MYLRRSVIKIVANGKIGVCMCVCVLLLGVSLMMDVVLLLLTPLLLSELTRLLRYSGLILD